MADERELKPGDLLEIAAVVASIEGSPVLRVTGTRGAQAHFDPDAVSWRRMPDDDGTLAIEDAEERGLERAYTACVKDLAGIFDIELPEDLPAELCWEKLTQHTREMLREHERLTVAARCSTCSGSGVVPCAAHINGDGCTALQFPCPDCTTGSTTPAPEQSLLDGLAGVVHHAFAAHDTELQNLRELNANQAHTIAEHGRRVGDVTAERDQARKRIAEIENLLEGFRQADKRLRDIANERTEQLARAIAERDEARTGLAAALGGGHIRRLMDHFGYSLSDGPDSIAANAIAAHQHERDRANRLSDDLQHARNEIDRLGTENRAVTQERDQAVDQRDQARSRLDGIRALLDADTVEVTSVDDESTQRCGHCDGC